MSGPAGNGSRKGSPFVVMTIGAVVLGVALVFLMTPGSPPTSESPEPVPGGANKGGTTLPLATTPPEIKNLDQLDPQMAATVRRAVAKVRSNPGSGGTWGELGQIYHAHRYYQLAQESFRKAHALSPATPDWAHYLGLLAMERGQTQEAVQYLELALSEAPLESHRESLATAHHLGNVLLSVGRLEEAQLVFEELTHQSFSKAWGLLGLAKIASQKTQWNQVTDLLEEAQNLESENREINYLLATAYRELGSSTKASNLFARATSLEFRQPPDPRMSRVAEFRQDLQASITRANKLLANGRMEDAETLYRQILTQDDRHFDAYFNLGVLLGRSGRLEEALAAMETAAEIDPENAKAVRGIGTAYLEMRRPEEALPYLRRALELNPNDPPLKALLENAPP